MRPVLKRPSPRLPALARCRLRRFAPVVAAACQALIPAPGAAAPPPADSNFIIDVWETDQGLPENSATSMVQTPDGYLWFGTFNGLVRFDGVRFTVLDSSNAPDLPDSAIVNLHLDRIGRLWISTGHGLVVVKDGRWTRLGPETGWVGDYVRTFAEGHDGDMYLSTFDRRYLHFHDGRFEEIPSPIADPLQASYPFVDASGQFWLLHPRYVGRWTGRGWESQPVAFGAPADGFIGAGPARDGGLWVVSRKHLRKYRDGRAIVDVPVTAPIDGFWSLYEDSTGVVWIASFAAGVYRYSPSTGWLHLTTANGLSYDALRFIVEDHEGNIWLGSNGGGLMRLKARTLTTWGARQGLPERLVKSIAIDPGGTVFIGTHGAGVVRLDGAPVATRRSGPTYVNALLIDRRHRLWMGLFGGGLQHFDVESLLHRPVLLPEADNRVVYALFEDSRGRVWAGGDDRVLVDDDGRSIEITLPKDTTVRAFAEEPHTGTILAGTTGSGLQRLVGGRFEPVPAAHGLTTAGISALLADPDGTLWIGTIDNGLACLTHDRLVRLGEAQGISARGISAIVDDLRGSLWLGTNHGVIRLARKDLAAVVAGRQAAVIARVYDRSDGLASTECPMAYQPTAMRDREGRIWFATIKGAALVDPAALHPNAVAPSVIVDEVRVDDRLVGGARLDPLRWTPPPPVVLPAGSKRVEVHYAGISLTSPERVHFKYRVDGLDTDWVDAGTRRVVYLQDLSPGTYAFQVAAANTDNVWSASPAVLGFTVRPFWWQTLWFRILAAIGLIGGIGLTGWRASRVALRREFERQAHEHALDQERSRLASVLDVTSDCVAFAGPTGRLLYLNPAGRRILGYPPSASLEDRTLADLHPPAAAARLIEEAVPAATRDGLWSGETTLVGHDGTEIPVSQVIAVHRSAGGEVEFLSTIARDLTDRVRAEQQLVASEERLRQSQKMEAVGRLAGGIAHDFNNLLTVITGYTALLLESRQKSDPDFVPIEETYKAAERAADLTRQLLAFSRKQVLTPARLDVNTVVRTLETMLRPLIGEHIELVIDLAPDLALVNADRSQLEQVIVNLAVNARDAMPDGGRLTLRTSNTTLGGEQTRGNPELVPGDYVLLAVCDAGAGIEPAVKERIFEPFYTTKAASGGTGLGLATVYGIVRQSGGCIEVTSSMGHGTTFNVYLPRDNGTREDAQRTATSAAPARGHEVVLLVEDEASVRRIARVALERSGYTVLEAGSPADARRLSASYAGDIDLLVTDVVMPQMNGRELASQLSLERPLTKVLYVSGYTDDAILRHGVLEADVEFLQKPFTPETLARKVRDVLDTRSR